ncbi:MAG: single-stranded DNA-binding protein [Lachnospiraceae bacterium]|nr:single-stranded DNA-binding protein [Lachnospiraceae bacterium]
MNKVILMGRLTREPEVRYSQGESQTAISRFTLAVDRRFKKDGEATADFISCVAFGKQAEFVERYLHQGTKIVAEGHIQTGSYTNKDGHKVYTTDVMVETLEFAESKLSSENGSRTKVDEQGFMTIPEDDEGVPFA